MGVVGKKNRDCGGRSCTTTAVKRDHEVRQDHKVWQDHEVQWDHEVRQDHEVRKDHHRCLDCDDVSNCH